MTDSDRNISARLGSLRRAAGMSQSELARRSGVNLQTLQKLESGVNRVLGAKVETVLALANALDLSVEDIVNVTQKKERE